MPPCPSFLSIDMATLSVRALNQNKKKATKMTAVGDGENSNEGGLADAFVLLVEDDPDDVHVIKRVLNQAPIQVQLEVVAHGREAIDFLEDSAQDSARKLPDLILLDLNMPVMDGNQFLRTIRNHASLSALPVCVFTTSTDEEVIKNAYEDGANVVVNKVDSLAGMSHVLNTIIDFWFKTAKRYYV